MFRSIGGNEAERQAREDYEKAEQDEHRKNLQEFREMQKRRKLERENSIEKSEVMIPPPNSPIFCKFYLLNVRLVLIQSNT